MSSISLINGLCATTGYTWIPEDDLRNYVKKKTGNSSLSFLNRDVKAGQIVVSKVKDKLFFSTKKINDKENLIVNNIYRVMNYKHLNYDNWTVDQLINNVEEEKGIKLDVVQRDAVKMACNNQFMVLTGGPGTGKTCVLSVISEVLHKLDPSLCIKYAAPTGKASKRMSESVGETASTVSSLLKIGINPDADPQPISSNYKCVIVDEVSMLDTNITNAFFKAVPSGTKVIFVGDIDQLPSVGIGAILRDFINSGCIPVTKLVKTFRQAGDSILFDNIQKVKNNDYHLVSGDDFSLVCPHQKVPTADVLLNLYLQCIKEYGIKNVLLLTPYNKCGDSCAIKMNAKIQAVLNKSTKCVVSNGIKIAVNDPIMHVNNSNSLSNGDIGVIKDIIGDNIYIEIAGRNKGISINSFFNEYTLAYAMTVHKSQGSEAKCVITSMMNGDGAMLQKNLLYTAITRAKTKCFLVCDPQAIKTAINNKESLSRVTMLKEKLIAYNAKKGE